MEIWKEIKGYEGFYLVSNLGRVKTLHGKKERILKDRFARGYLIVFLSNKNKKENKYIHIIVAENFLNHKPCGYERVVDHINGDKLDNRASNLQIVSHRENLTLGYLRKKTSSKYTGVCWDKSRKKWISNIYINGFHKFLGRFNNEEEAHNAYQKALKSIL